ncbi:MAG: TlyA family RNA methyltransferase [Nitrospirales bacterium]|nr:MAG: TlyA family RNA methyltransferase [Nitrospirales bacterium]
MSTLQPSLPSRKPTKQRLDSLLVSLSLVPSREQASRLILAGRVKVDGLVRDKPGKLVPSEVEVEIVQPDCQYASRGGEKLAPALEAFGLSCKGLVVMDVGASTGGFTDCVLQRGAGRVYAIDVGYGQLDWRLRSDARVIVMDRVNARYLRPEDIPELVDLVVIDVSFISLKMVWPAILPILKPQGYLVSLVKPQFEVGKGQVGKGGIVRDERLREAVKGQFVDYAKFLSLDLVGLIDSPVLGKKGNKEILIGLKKR